MSAWRQPPESEATEAQPGMRDLQAVALGAQPVLHRSGEIFATVASTGRSPVLVRAPLPPRGVGEEHRHAIRLRLRVIIDRPQLATPRLDLGYLAAQRVTPSTDQAKGSAMESTHPLPIGFVSAKHGAHSLFTSRSTSP